MAVSWIVVALLMSSTAIVVMGAARDLNDTKASESTNLLFPAMLIFGDSTVDAGNNNFLPTIVKSDFWPYGMNFEGGRPTGRFSDGMLATDFICQKAGIPLQLPYLSPEAHGQTILTGVNFASSASGWSEDTAALYNVIGLATQLQWYRNWKAEVYSLVGPTEGNYIIENALNIISTGTNDWVNNYYIDPIVQKQYSPEQYINMLLGFVRKYVQELYASGGRNILILNLPPLGCLPQQITLHGLGNQGCVRFLNEVVTKFNKQLDVLVEELKRTMLNSKLILFDAYEVIYDAFQRPQNYGFKYTRIGCCGTGVFEVSILCNKGTPICQNCSEHMFWDSFHPTSHLYHELAELLFIEIEHVLKPTT